MEASLQGHVEVVRLVLEACAHTNLVNHHGGTALMWASEGGHAEVASVLLEARAQTNLSDHQGNTALMFAFAGGHTDVVRLLIRVLCLHELGRVSRCHCFDVRFLYGGHIGVLRLLLESCAHTNLADDDGFTALTVSSGKPHSSFAVAAVCQCRHGFDHDQWPHCLDMCI